jgi:hypothetical protein
MGTEPETASSQERIVTSEEKSVSVSVEAPTGAMYHALHVSRTVKTYPIQEHELYALDDLGRNATLWTAISAGGFALLASCVWSMIQLQPPAKISNGEVGFMVLLAVVTVVSFLIGKSYGKKRKSRLEKIMNECG